MTPRRDPETGKFVSGDAAPQVSWPDIKMLAGGITAEIPAAQLAGEASSHNIFDQDAEAMTLTDVLDNNEVYQILAMRYHAAIDLPTTATAESHGALAWGIGTASDGPRSSSLSPGNFGGPSRLQHTEGGFTSDINSVPSDSSSSPDDPGHWIEGYIPASSSVGDSTNGLGAGGDSGQEYGTIPFAAMLGDGPFLDRDDEVIAPMEIMFNNISDHAIYGHIGFNLFGVVHQI